MLLSLSISFWQRMTSIRCHVTELPELLCQRQQNFTSGHNAMPFVDITAEVSWRGHTSMLWYGSSRLRWIFSMMYERSRPSSFVDGLPMWRNVLITSESIIESAQCFVSVFHDSDTDQWSAWICSLQGTFYRPMLHISFIARHNVIRFHLSYAGQTNWSCTPVHYIFVPSSLTSVIALLYCCLICHFAVRLANLLCKLYPNVCSFFIT